MAPVRSRAYQGRLVPNERRWRTNRGTQRGVNLAEKSSAASAPRPPARPSVTIRKKDGAICLRYFPASPRKAGSILEVRTGPLECREGFRGGGGVRGRFPNSRPDPVLLLSPFGSERKACWCGAAVREDLRLNVRMFTTDVALCCRGNKP